MSKNLPVASLKQGDRFEFNSNPADGAKSAVMVVTREPSVNLAANSCHFRYQPEHAADGTRKWDENQSWNGTPDVKVRLVEAASKVEPPAKTEAPARVEPPAKIEVAAIVEPVKRAETPAPLKKKPAKKTPLKKAAVEKVAVRKTPRRRRAL